MKMEQKYKAESGENTKSETNGFGDGNYGEAEKQRISQVVDAHVTER